MNPVGYLRDLRKRPRGGGEGQQLEQPDRVEGRDDGSIVLGRMEARERDRDRKDRDHEEHAQRMRERHAVGGRSVFLAEVRHLGGAPGHATEKGRRAIGTGQPREDPRRKRAVGNRRKTERHEPRPQRCDFMEHRRGEVEPEVRADHDEPRFAPAADRVEARAGELCRAHREDRADHPGQRSADPRAHGAAQRGHRHAAQRGDDLGPRIQSGSG
jgi:hypothetical protein